VSFAINEQDERRQLREGFQPIHQDTLCVLGDVMNFARARLLRLGDLKFTTENLIRRAMADRPEDTLIPWIPLWGGDDEQQHKSDDDTTGTTSIITKQREHPFSSENTTPLKHQSSLVQNSLQFHQQNSFQDRYLQLTTASIQLDVLAGRTRHAAHLRSDMAEVHFLRGEFGSAVENLKLVVLVITGMMMV